MKKPNPQINMPREPIDNNPMQLNSKRPKGQVPKSSLGWTNLINSNTQRNFKSQCIEDPTHGMHFEPKFFRKKFHKEIHKLREILISWFPSREALLQPSMHSSRYKSIIPPPW
jgi:hypothetical protein